MTSIIEQQPGLAILCNAEGVITRVVQDDFGITLAFEAPLEGCSMASILDHASVDKSVNFLNTIQADGSAEGWELNVNFGDTAKTLVFQGYQTEAGLLIIGAEAMSTAVKIHRQLCSILSIKSNHKNIGVKPIETYEQQNYELYNKLTELTSELVAMQRDMVKKNRLLQQLNDEKNAFLGMAAHDLRSPLTVILAYTELLHEDIQEAGQRELLSNIHSSVDFMLGLINNLLDISKIEAGKLELNAKPLDLTKLMASNVTKNQILAKQKTITIQNYVGKLPAVMADAAKVEQVLYNLISNAIKFSEPGSTISISGISKENGVEIAVSDQGRGIPPEEIGQLFKPFSRASTKSTGGESTTGLGLVIAKRIVEEHGGKIWLESRINQGTTFYFTLPLSEAPLNNAETEGQPQVPSQVNRHSANGNGAGVLVVDDDPIILDYISMGLSHRGYKVSTANNGAEALRIAEALKPELVILDWVLPDAQGPDICRRIRNLIDPVIVMLSSKAELADKVTGLQSGADDYQTKPFHFEELLARIESLLRRQGTSAVKKTLKFGNLTLWPERREVRQGENRLALTPTEFDLLHLFMRHPHQVLPKDNILQSVWGSSYLGDVNIVEVYIGYLRRKLGKPSPIKTVRGVGYVLEEKNK